jgi:hypothetical protein
MKNYLLLLTLSSVLFISGCTDIEVLETQPVNLGTVSKSTDIKNIKSTNGVVTVQYLLTTGAKYSVQVYKFAALEPEKTLPLTAESEIVTKIYDFTDLSDGLYDLVLTDVSGVSIRKPLLLKR